MKKLIWLLLLVTASMWAQTTNYNPGTTAAILNAVTTTGTGTCYALLNQGAIPANFTWQTVIAGGTASSITVVFEGSLNNDCSNPSTIDTSTSTSGETRSVANKAYPYVTANITAYSRNGTTATVNFVAQYGSGIPTPSASNLCFVSQGAFQGSWTWAACSGAGGTVTASGSPVAQDVAVFSSPSAITGTTGLTWDGTTLTNNLGTGGNIQTESYFGDFYDVGPTGGKWIWLEATSGGFHVAFHPATLTGTRTTTFPDGDSNTVQPLTSGTTHEWVSYINSAGTQNLTQPACGDLSNAGGGCSSGATFPSSGVIPVVPTGSGATVGEVLLSAQFSTTDTVNCPNNTTANFATTYTIPANYLTANRVIRVTMGFTIIATATVPTFAIRMSIGGVATYTTTAAAPSANNPTIVGTSLMIQGTAAAGAAVAVHVHPIYGAGLFSSVVTPWNVDTTAQPVTLATNGTLVIQPILFCGANTANNSATLNQLIVEGLN